MLPHSEAFAEAAVESRRVVTRAELVVTSPSGTSVVPASVVDGEVTASRNANYRYGCDLVLAPDVQIGRDGLSPYRTRIRLFRGFTTARGEEVVPAGVYRVLDTRSGLPLDRVQVAGQGLEAYLVDDGFVQPRVFPGGSAVGALTTLITESVPGDVEVVSLVPDVVVGAAVWEERWGGEDAACQMLATALGAQVYADAGGRFVIAPVPTVDDAPVGWVQVGKGLVRAERDLSREGAANVVIAESSASGETVPPGIAWDSDPFSPTFAGGPDGKVGGGFGRVLRRYSSPLLLSAGATATAARTVLAESTGLLSNLRVTEVVNPAREPSDVVGVDTDRGQERRVIDQIRYPVGPGESNLSTRVLRVVT